MTPQPELQEKPSLISSQPKESWQYLDSINRWVHPKAMQVYLQAVLELADTDYQGLDHGHRRAYKKGCRGPLCRKAMRDYGREYQRERYGLVTRRWCYKQQFDDLLELVLERRGNVQDMLGEQLKMLMQDRPPLGQTREFAETRSTQ